MPMHKYYFAKA